MRVLSSAAFSIKSVEVDERVVVVFSTWFCGVSSRKATEEGVDENNTHLLLRKSDRS